MITDHSHDAGWPPDEYDQCQVVVSETPVTRGGVRRCGKQPVDHQANVTQCCATCAVPDGRPHWSWCHRSAEKMGSRSSQVEPDRDEACSEDPWLRK